MLYTKLNEYEKKKKLNINIQQQMNEYKIFRLLFSSLI